MAAETAQQFASLEAQAQVLMSCFAKAGHEAVAPAIIQPASVFLDVIGESLRARTYVFADPDGAELCLRPDLTVPTCRLHLVRVGDDAGRVGKYCYNGPAFRYQPQGADAAHPREFRQAGIERFGETEREVAEAETIRVLVYALEAAGLKNWTLHIGDIGLFSAILDVVALPERWRRRLRDEFQRPAAFRDELRRMTREPARFNGGLAAEVLPRLTPGDLGASEAAVAGFLEQKGIELIGTRTLAEMTERLLGLREDAQSARLDAKAAQLIEAYVGVSGPARTAGERIADLVKGARGRPDAALASYDRRLARLANVGIDLNRVSFAAEFGRDLAYYTGLVFEVRAPGFGAESPIAGGGRYDGLIRAAGASADVPAVGGAIHTERLLAAVTGRRA